MYMYKLVIYNQDSETPQTVEIDHRPNWRELKKLAPESMEVYLVEEDHNGETFAMYAAYRHRVTECFSAWRPYYTRRNWI